MSTSITTTDVDRLLAVLDQDVRYLEQVLIHLDALRGALIRRDDAALDGLLHDIRRDAQSHAANEQERQELTAALARACACDQSDLTLSRLQAALPERQRQCIAARQARLRSLVAELKREHRLTVMLVSDVGRFNRSLLQALFGRGGKGCMTYSPTGAARQRDDGRLVSLQF